MEKQLKSLQLEIHSIPWQEAGHSVRDICSRGSAEYEADWDTEDIFETFYDNVIGGIHFFYLKNYH